MYRLAIKIVVRSDEKNRVALLHEFENEFGKICQQQAENMTVRKSAFSSPIKFCEPLGPGEVISNIQCRFGNQDSLK